MDGANQNDAEIEVMELQALPIVNNGVLAGQPAIAVNPKAGVQLRQELKERHVNMMAFSACLGVGLFLQSGRIIFLAGPGLAFIAYMLMGTVMWSAAASLGEMTALFPISGSIFDFPARFLDIGVGYAAGWMTWFSWTVIIAAEVLAITQIFKFEFKGKYLKDHGYPRDTLGWGLGWVNEAAWVVLFLFLIGVVNTLPVRWYGRLEYVFGVMKMVFLVGLVLFNIVLSAREVVKGQSGFWTYRKPFGFMSNGYILTTKNDTTAIAEAALNTVPQVADKVINGAAGRLLGMWSAMTTTIFSMIGFETVAISAAENKDLDTNETVKMSTRKISLRVITLYTLCVFAVGLNVPYHDENLQDLTVNSFKSSENSAFMLAAVRKHVLGWPHFFNGFFVFSATTSGMNALYNSSRILHALASLPDAWPDWKFANTVRLKLMRTKSGVPLAAVFLSWLFGCLAFLSTEESPAEVLGRLAIFSTVSMLIVYGCICASYLSFYTCIERIAKGEDQSIDTNDLALRQRYDRSVENQRFPYRTHLQWWRACYGLLGCTLMVIFNGWRTFVRPMNTSTFIASYISIIIFLLLVTAFHFKFELSRNPLNWSRMASMDVQHPMPLELTEEAARRRRGRLHLPDRGLTLQNTSNLVEWIWTWLK